ncbi:MAG: metalloregulator ArsR/SmtB family transcription factor [Vicinamibacterales bacterium]
MIAASSDEPMTATPLQTFKARFFRALGHPSRIRILETLVRGDRSVQELQVSLGLGQPVVSQQLAVLRNQGIVTSRKQGLSVRYALRDPAIGELLSLARRIFNRHLVDTGGMLRELKKESRRR